MRKVLKEYSLKEIKQFIQESLQDTAIESILEDDSAEESEVETKEPQWVPTIITPSMQEILKRWGAKIVGKSYMKKIDILLPITLLSDLNSKDSYIKKEFGALSQQTAPVVTQIKKRVLKDRIKATVNGDPYSVLQCTWGDHGNLVFNRVV